MSSDIEVTHNGTANASVGVTVLNPSALKDGSYKVTFDTQVFARDINGVWNKVVSRSAASVSDATDCGESEIIATAYASSIVGTIDLVLDFTLACADGAWIDGIQMTFPTGFAANVNTTAVTGVGNICSYGADSGQDCENTDGSWTGDVLLYGHDKRTGFGAFESSNTFTVNYTPSNSTTWDLPLDVGFVIYDDHYTDVNSDGTGTATASSQNFEEKTEYHWNLSTASGTVLLEDQTFLGGADLYGC
jgi:predicted secreted protein